MKKRIEKPYSTVVKYSSDRGSFGSPKSFVFRLSVRLFSSDFWVPPYTPYQHEVFGIIKEKHETEGWNFKQISDWLNEQNYTTPRGKVFRQNHVWSIYKKKKRSIERCSREFIPEIKTMSIQVGG